MFNCSYTSQDGGVWHFPNFVLFTGCRGAEFAGALRVPPGRDDESGTQDLQKGWFLSSYSGSPFVFVQVWNAHAFNADHYP